MFIAGFPTVATCNVLIVDDDRDLRDALADALTAAGFGVADACSGSEALARVRARQFDVVLLDMQMPGTDGSWFIERLDVVPRPRIIVLTADLSARVLRFAKDATLLQKPVDLDALEHAVAEACAA